MSNLIKSQFGVSSNISGTKHFIAGVELEIESICDFGSTSKWDEWNITEDGSLRNNGRELISPPLPLEKLVEGFKAIHSQLVYYHKDQAFSERTSIHVHVNMLDNTLDHGKSMLLWYALFEPCFFAMVAPNRRNNIHCVGLDQTNMSEYYNRSLSYIQGKWHKYAAFNMKPLGNIGTIEFRHMEGHNDPVRFESWLKTLRNLWQFSQDFPMSEDLLTEKEIGAAFTAIFKDAPTIQGLKPSLMNLLSNNILDIKLSFLPNSKD